MRTSLFCPLLALSAVLSPAPTVSGAAGLGSRGYLVSSTIAGIRLTVHFLSRTYPAHALIEVTTTLHNVSRRHLAVPRATAPYGLCDGPLVSIVSVDRAGQYVQPPSPIPPPALSCAAPKVSPLPVGSTVVEHPLVMLLTARVRITAQLYNLVHNCYCGFEFPYLYAQFRLHTSAAPTISVRRLQGATAATVTPPPGVRGQFFYRSWGNCAGLKKLVGSFYWTRRRARTISSICSNPVTWHLDVAWIGTPVASLNLGVRRRSKL